MLDFESKLDHESPSYQALFNHATMGIIIVNAEGNIQLANPFALDLFGFKETELLGMEIDVLIPCRFQAKHAQHHVSYLSNPQSRPMGFGMDLFAVKKDKTEFPVEISLGSYNDDKGEKNIIAFVTDITAPKKAKLEILKMNNELELTIEERTKDLIKTLNDLEESKLNLQKALTFQKALLENAGAMIVTVNESGFIQTFNPEAEKELGYQALELIGKHKPLLYHDPELIEARAKEYSKELKKKIEPGMDLFFAKSQLGLVNENEWIYVRKDGTKFPVQLSVAAMKNEQGDIIGYVSVAFNISRIKEIELELQYALEKEKELSELKTRFVSMASHEFRTPLSTVLSSIYLLKQYNSIEDHEKREKHFDRIISSVNMLTDILNDFLSVGKIEEGKIQVKYSSFNIRNLVLKISSEMINSLKNKQEIHSVHNGDPDVYLDESLMKHIIMNLISNASKFSPETCMIDIKTICRNNTIKLVVRDYGIGISKADQQHLMERFFRGSNASAIQGTGLGLHIVSKYVELMNGTMLCKSKLDKGTEFIILFKTSNHDHEKNSTN